MLRELSVFCDESGDFGPVEEHCPFYIVALVFHDQSAPFAARAEAHARSLRESGFDAGAAIHTGPLVRREAPYEAMPLDRRRKLFGKLFTLFRLSDVSAETFAVDKRAFGCGGELSDRIARELGAFLAENLVSLQGYDRVVVYYDLGQKELTRTLRTVFSAHLSNVELRIVRPQDYLLFQVADMACTLRLLDEKRRTGRLSASEDAFFGGARKLRKAYLDVLRRKRFAG